MKLKRVLAVLCMVTLLLPTVCGIQPLAADDKVISYAEPAILADVGDTIKLTDYKYKLQDGTVLEGLTWTYNDAEVTEFKPEDDIVYALKATKGDKTKNVYVVAKEKTATEYVLYYNEFNAETDIDGWNKRTAASNYTVADGKLTLNGTASNAIAYLPAWIADFGNYRVDFSATQTDAADTARWISFIFRAKNVTAGGSPYYHMCVRKNMTQQGSATTGGVECVSNTGSWTYYKSAGYTENIDPDTFYKFSVLVKDSVCQYQIDDNVVIHLDNLAAINPDITGGIGLQANQSKLVVDYIKITIQKDAPVYVKPEVPKNLQFVEHADSNILNAPTNVAIVDSAEKMNGLQKLTVKPSNAMFYLDKDLNVTLADGTKIGTIDDAITAVGENIIPAFYVKDKETVTAATTKLKAAKLLDVLFISANPDVSMQAMKANALFRGAVDFTALEGDTITKDQLYNIRATTRKAKCLIAILPAKFATLDNVLYLEELGLTVWIMDDKLESKTEAARYITSGAYGIISDNHELVADCFTSLFISNTLTKTPVIIGHRGNPSQGPENSISNYLKAVENGAQVVETDIRPSKDGEVIVMHDDTLTRTTSYNGSATVAQMTLAEIKEYFLWGTNDQYKSTHPDEKVPTFEEMLIALKDTDVKIFVELKGGDSAFVKKAMELVKKHGYEDRVFVISFSGSLLEYTQLHMPEMGTGLLSSISQFETEEEMYNSLYGAMLNFQGSYKSTYNPSYGGLTPELVAALRDRGITIWPWTFNNSTTAQFQTAFLASVGGITTDTAQYSKNMTRKVYADKYDFTLNVGEEATFNAEAVLYAGTLVDITKHRSASIKFIEGEDVISVEDGKITALKDGTASFMIRYNVRTSPVGQYNLYTQPITVTVGTPSPETSEGEDVSNDVSTGDNGDGKDISPWIFVGCGVALVAIAAIVIVIMKKGKK